MKASASYNPVTQSAGGSYEDTASDHRERRKDTLFTGGVILVIVAIIAVIAWYIWKNGSAAVTAAITAPLTALKSASDAIVTSTVVPAANSATAVVTQAKDNLGDYYPVKTLTTADYAARLGGTTPVVAIAVQAGNLITPQTLLDAAATAGSQSAQTVNDLGLNDAYVDLSLPEKALVTLGQGIGSIFGVNLIQLGYDQRTDVVTANANQSDGSLGW